MRVGLGSGEMEREKGEGKDWGKLEEVVGWRWRKGGYGSREEIYIKEAILGLARDLALEGFPGVHRMSPARSWGSRAGLAPLSHRCLS